MKDPPQKFKISYLNSVCNFFIISNFKSSGLNSKSYMGRKIFNLKQEGWLTVKLVQEYIYREDIFCKSWYQISKPIEICNFVLWYHEDNNSANVYYDLAYLNKIAIKRIRSLKVKQVHFFCHWKQTKHRTWSSWEGLLRTSRRFTRPDLDGSFQQRKDFCILKCRFLT